MNEFRGWLYRLGSILGWINAFSRGLAAVLRRCLRIFAFRGFGRLLRRWGL